MEKAESDGEGKDRGDLSSEDEDDKKATKEKYQKFKEDNPDFIQKQAPE
jgi:hypothetical protein